MNDTIHFAIESKTKGYIRPYSTLACGLDSEIPSGEADKLVRTISLTAVTCDWCKLVLEKKKDEPVTRRELDERVVNMTFNNRSMSAHDVEKAIAEGVQKGVDQAVARITKDFSEARVPLRQLVEDGVEMALRRGQTRRQLIDIFKIADDELAQEAEDSPESAEKDAQWDEDVKQLIRDVLNEREQARAGVGTTVVQNFSPAPLTAEQLWRSAFLGETSSPGMTVNAEVDPESFKQMVIDAIREEEDDTLEEYEENETALMQKAVASIVTSDEFQALIKKLVKEGIEEDRQVEYRRKIEERFLGSAWTFPTGRISFGNVDPIITLPQKTVKHYRKLYQTTTACAARMLDDVETTHRRDKVTCQACKNAAGITY